MGRYQTRAGVVIEMNDDAARAVGYRPVETVRKTRATRGSRKKVDENAVDENDE